MTLDLTADRIGMEDLTARHQALTEERAELLDALTDARETLTDALDDTSALAPEEIDERRDALATAEAELADWDGAEELATLDDIIEELRGAGGGDHKYNGDWFPGELIADHAFTEHARELAESCYSIPDTWPHRCIDWEEAAEELRGDYSMIDIDGNTYLWR